MSFSVSIDQFEGPLDLMLHLIRENKLDLMDLDIHVLTEQYLLYLNTMEKLQLEVASEYLLELATLVEYKSKKLLPKNTEELADEYEEDPKDRLVRRLLEYQQFKEVSGQLNEYYEQRQKQFTKPVSLECEEWIKTNETGPVQGNPYDLVKAMSKVLRRMQLLKPIETKFTAREISVDDRILELRVTVARMKGSFSFDELVHDCTDQYGVIVTFLAILDMARLHELVFHVDEEERIWFRKGNDV